MKHQSRVSRHKFGGFLHNLLMYRVGFYKTILDKPKGESCIMVAKEDDIESRESKSESEEDSLNGQENDNKDLEDMESYSQDLQHRFMSENHVSREENKNR